MLLRIGFVTVITAASITGAFVAPTRKDEKAAGDSAKFAEELRGIVERLERIEASLNQRS